MLKDCVHGLQLVRATKLLHRFLGTLKIRPKAVYVDINRVHHSAPAD